MSVEVLVAGEIAAQQLLSGVLFDEDVRELEHVIVIRMFGSDRLTDTIFSTMDHGTLAYMARMFQIEVDKRLAGE